MARLQGREPIAILGAGHGGQALAADLALQGWPVHLYNRSPERLQPLLKAGGIRLEGAAGRGWARLARVTHDLEEAVTGTSLILVVTPATAHIELARQLAPLLRDGQTIVLCPGRTLGAWHVVDVLRQYGQEGNVTVAECNTFLFASRTVGPARSMVHAVKARVGVAALPYERTGMVVQQLRQLYPCFLPAADLLETGLDNIGMLFHPAPVLANLARVEAGQPFEHYTEGISPAVARLIEALDKERLAVARRLGVKLRPARLWLAETYGAAGSSLYEALQKQQGYRGIPAPRSLATRYLWEDIPCGLVPLASLGRHYGVETPVANSLVHLAGAALGHDWWSSGRTLERLGLSGLSVSELRETLRTGSLPGRKPWFPTPMESPSQIARGRTAALPVSISSPAPLPVNIADVGQVAAGNELLR